MTDNARLHSDECCLIFDLSIKSSSPGSGKDYYTKCILYRDATSTIIFKAQYSFDNKNKRVANCAGMVKEYNEEWSEGMQNLQNGFIVVLKRLMAWCDIIVEKLAESYSISPRTIQRLRNEEGYETTSENVIILCIGMKMSPVESYHLVERAGFTLIFSEKHHAYRFLLSG